MTIPNPDPNRYFNPAYRKAIEEEARRLKSQPRSADEWAYLFESDEERDPNAPEGFETDEELQEFLVAYREWRRSG